MEDNTSKRHYDNLFFCELIERLRVEFDEDDCETPAISPKTIGRWKQNLGNVYGKTFENIAAQMKKKENECIKVINAFLAEKKALSLKKELKSLLLTKNFLDILKIIYNKCKNEESFEAELDEAVFGPIGLGENIKECLLKELAGLGVLDDAFSFETAKINEKWLPNISGKGMDLPDFIIDKIQDDALDHILLYCDEGSGKTYSMIKTTISLFEQGCFYQKKTVVPVYIPARFADGITRYFSKLAGISYAEMENNRYELFCRGDIHWIFLIDGINERENIQEIKSEIGRLSDPLNECVTLVVSCTDKEELSLDGWERVTFDPLEKKVVKAELLEKNVKGPSKQLVALLQRPFYLGAFMDADLSLNKGDYVDLFTIVRSYLETQVNKRLAYNSVLREMIDDEMPERCIGFETRAEKFYIEYRDEGAEKKQGINGLVSIGVLMNHNNYILFKHEIYYTYFCAKKIIDLFVCLMDDGLPVTVKRKLLGETSNYLTSKISQNIYGMVATRLNNLGKLDKAVELFCEGEHLDNSILHANLLRLYSMASSDLDGIDLSGRSLWLVDFSNFKRLRNCNLDNCILNPETLGLLDTKIIYSKAGMNTALVEGPLVLLSDENGIEVYNVSNDKKVYFTAAGMIRKIFLRSDTLFVCAGNDVFGIGMETIGRYLEKNTRDRGIAISGIENVKNYPNGFDGKLDGPDGGNLNEDAGTPMLEGNNGLLCSYGVGDSIKYVLERENGFFKLSLPKRHEYRMIDITNIDYKKYSINDNGDVLFISNDRFIIYRYGTEKVIEVIGFIEDASFMSDGRVFLDKGGVYEIFDDEMGTCWRKTVLPVYPEFYSNKDGKVVFQMLGIDSDASEFFIGDYDGKVFKMVSEKNDLPRKQVLKTPDDDGIQVLAGKFEGIDCCNYRYYRQKDKSLCIYDRDGKLIMHMYGSLLDYSGSSFNGAHFDCVDDDDNKKYFGILTAFGAKRA